MSTQTLARHERRVPVQPVTQGRAIGSEWVKLSTLRSTWITLAAAFVGTIAIGALALRHGVVLHELTPQQASLEQAFMDLTRDDVEFRAEELEEGALV